MHQNSVLYINKLNCFCLILCLSDSWDCTIFVCTLRDEKTDSGCYCGRAPLFVLLESANITVSDVSKVEVLAISGPDGTFSTVYFVPNCTFQHPKAGEWRELEKNMQEFCKRGACLT